jgi:hypothetical protein
MYIVIEIGAFLLLFAVFFLCLVAIVLTGILVWLGGKSSFLWANLGPFWPLRILASTWKPECWFQKRPT